MMMTMYSLHSTPSPTSLPSSADNGRTADVKMVINTYHVDSADCCLIGIVLGVTTKRNIPQ